VSLILPQAPLIGLNRLAPVADEFYLVGGLSPHALVKAVGKAEETGLRPCKMIFLPDRLAFLPAFGALNLDRKLIAFQEGFF
jgi:hypothetical protein